MLAEGIWTSRFLFREAQPPWRHGKLAPDQPGFVSHANSQRKASQFPKETEQLSKRKKIRAVLKTGGR